MLSEINKNLRKQYDRVSKQIDTQIKIMNQFVELQESIIKAIRKLEKEQKEQNNEQGNN